MPKISIFVEVSEGFRVTQPKNPYNNKNILCIEILESI